MASQGTAFPHLATPITLGGVTLRNRIVMGSMHTGLEGRQTEKRFGQLARFYAERAQRRLRELIVTGGFAPNHAGRMEDEPSTIEREPDQVPLHRRITAAGARGRRPPSSCSSCTPRLLPLPLPRRRRPLGRSRSPSRQVSGPAELADAKMRANRSPTTPGPRGLARAGRLTTASR